MVTGTDDSRTVRELRGELHKARQLAIELTPPEVQRVLGRLAGLPGAEAITEDQAAEDILQLAKGWETAAGDYAFCPACEAHKGNADGSIRGMRPWPEGLRRHLLGQKRANQCSVVSTAIALRKERGG